MTCPRREQMEVQQRIGALQCRLAGWSPEPLTDEERAGLARLLQIEQARLAELQVRNFQ